MWGMYCMLPIKNRYFMIVALTILASYDYKTDHFPVPPLSCYVVAKRLGIQSATLSVQLEAWLESCSSVQNSK